MWFYNVTVHFIDKNSKIEYILIKKLNKRIHLMQETASALWWKGD